MLRVQTAEWDEPPETLREYALRANHPRTRERFMALYEICLAHIYLDTDEGYG